MLPEEILFMVFGFLDVKELIACSHTCSQWSRICLDKLLWLQKAELFGPESPIEQFINWRKLLCMGGSYNILTRKKIIRGIAISNSGMCKAYNYGVIFLEKYHNSYRENEVYYKPYPLFDSIKYIENILSCSYGNEDPYYFYRIDIDNRVPNENIPDMIKNFIGMSKKYPFINIFAFVCTQEKIQVITPLVSGLNLTMKIFHQDRWENVSEWISEVIWKRDFMCGSTFCLKKLPSLSELSVLSRYESELVTY
ncbi:putative F-box protein [Acanthamoeba polyphaga mimivirus]|uniref:Putative F-box protein n=1 Tax=Acanthamoeba polyphaga mimivirus TaxID=212035 RepID=A0A0G2XZW3_MIMIV|nr:putative F-box protein [Acanthamoeba polyphaga mimivirus]